MAYVSCATLDAKLALKQDQLKTPSGGDLPGGSCVMTCAEVLTAIADSGNVTAGTNVTVTGDGGLAAPYVVSVPDATTAAKGAVALATATDYPAPTNDTDAATPAYVAAALAAHEVQHDDTLTGTGTAADPLSVVSAPSLKCGNWSIECDAAGNLVFMNAGTRVAKIEPNGHITSANDLSAFCTV